eukprot:1998219-Pyramimonas_sp.AAC.1
MGRATSVERFRAAHRQPPRGSFGWPQQAPPVVWGGLSTPTGARPAPSAPPLAAPVCRDRPGLLPVEASLGDLGG